MPSISHRGHTAMGKLKKRKDTCFECSFITCLCHNTPIDYGYITCIYLKGHRSQGVCWARFFTYSCIHVNVTEKDGAHLFVWALYGWFGGENTRLTVGHLFMVHDTIGIVEWQAIIILIMNAQRWHLVVGFRCTMCGAVHVTWPNLPTPCRP